MDSKELDIKQAQWVEIRKRAIRSWGILILIIVVDLLINKYLS